jgi:2,3-bisphosphoglycerate-independent phosphoglycerate mutase
MVYLGVDYYSIHQPRVPAWHHSVISTENTLFVLLDGMEDDPSPQLDGKKPYEAADMPFIRKAAPNLAWTTGRGYTQLFLNEFWTGHPPDPATSRGAIEACGLGLDMSHGRTAFRLSPAYIVDNTVKWAYGVDDRADDLQQSTEDNMYLLGDCAPQCKFFVHGRAVITMDYGDYVPKPGPQAPVDGPYVPIEGPLGELIMQIASENEGLTLYPWGIGKVGKVYPAYPCLGKMTAISDSPTALGIAAMLGHKIKLVEKLEDRFPIARRALREGNVFLHMDEVDEYSHEKDPLKKVRVLELIDSLMAEYFSDCKRMVFFVDHGTSCVTGKHILMDVPFRTSFPCYPQNGHAQLKDVVPTIMGGM